MSTPTPIALESIDTSLLASVSGGCHKQTQIINNNYMPPAPPPAPAPQVAPPPAPMVQTSVSVNGQPAG